MKRKSMDKNESYHLTNQDKEILPSQDKWPNDNIMDAAQKLVCFKLPKSVSFFPDQGEHIQFIHDGNNHWTMTCGSNGRVPVCDNLRSRLSYVTNRCIQELCQTSLLPFQKQRNGWNCGLFSIAFTVEIGRNFTDGSKFGC